MDLKNTVDNLSGIDAVDAVDQLASIWGDETPVDATQVEATLAKSDAGRNQAINQAETQIAAEEKLVDMNDQAIVAGAAPEGAEDLDAARLEGIEQALDEEAAPIEKELGTQK